MMIASPNVKKIKENIRNINQLKNEHVLDEVSLVAGKTGDKIKANLKDLVPYKKGLEAVWKLKQQRSQDLIDQEHYTPDTKFYKRIDPKYLFIESGKYYISSHSEYKGMVYNLFENDALKFTHQEVIGAIDQKSNEYIGYGPLLVGFPLKDILAAGGVLIMHNAFHRDSVFEFSEQTKLPVTIENNTEWTIPLYATYQSLFNNLYGNDTSNAYVINALDKGFFSIYLGQKEDMRVEYTINNNNIVLTSESANIDNAHLKLALLGIAVKNGVELKGKNILIRRLGTDIPFEDFLSDRIDTSKTGIPVSVPKQPRQMNTELFTYIIPVTENVKKALGIHKDVVTVHGVPFQVKKELHVTAMGFGTKDLIKREIEEAKKRGEDLVAKINEILSDIDFSFALDPNSIKMIHNKDYDPNAVLSKQGKAAYESEYTIIIDAKMPAMKKFYRRMNDDLDIDLGKYATHLTLYIKDNGPATGLGIAITDLPAQVEGKAFPHVEVTQLSLKDIT